MRDTHTIANSLKERNSLSVELALSGSKRKPTKKADYRAPINRPNELTVELLPTEAQLAVFRRFNELTSSVWDFCIDYARHVKHGVAYEELAACLKGHFEELPAEVKQTTAWLAERAIRNHIAGDGTPSDKRVEFSFRFKYVRVANSKRTSWRAGQIRLAKIGSIEFRSRSPHAFKRGVKVGSTAIVDKILTSKGTNITPRTDRPVVALPLPRAPNPRTDAGTAGRPLWSDHALSRRLLFRWLVKEMERRKLSDAFGNSCGEHDLDRDRRRAMVRRPTQGNTGATSTRGGDGPSGGTELPGGIIARDGVVLRRLRLETLGAAHPHLEN